MKSLSKILLAERSPATIFGMSPFHAEHRAKYPIVVPAREGACSTSVGRSLVQGLVLVVMLSLLSACASTQNSRKSQEDAVLRLQSGTRFFQNQQYAAALRELLEAQRLDPRNPTIQNNLALTYFVRERFDLALKHINRAIELQPQYSEALNNRARIHIERGDYALAIADAKRVLDDLTYPAPVKAWNNIALAHFRKGDFREARVATESALRVDRQNCYAQTLHGRCQLEMNDLQAAAQTLDNALVACADQQDEEASYFAGLVQYKLGKHAVAVDRLENVVRKYPQGEYAQRAKSLLEIVK